MIEIIGGAVAGSFGKLVCRAAVAGCCASGSGSGRAVAGSVSGPGSREAVAGTVSGSSSRGAVAGTGLRSDSRQSEAEGDGEVPSNLLAGCDAAVDLDLGFRTVKNRHRLRANSQASRVGRGRDALGGEEGCRDPWVNGSEV